MTPGFAPGADPRVSSGMGAAFHGEPEGSGSLDRPHRDLGGQEGLDGDGGNLMVSAPLALWGSSLSEGLDSSCSEGLGFYH